MPPTEETPVSYFTGRGQRDVLILDFQECLELADMYTEMDPDNLAAKIMRASMHAIIQRYVAGDTSMIREIQQNAASNNPINCLARDSLPLMKNSSDKRIRKESGDDCALKKVHVEDQSMVKNAVGHLIVSRAGL